MIKSKILKNIDIFRKNKNFFFLKIKKRLIKIINRFFLKREKNSRYKKVINRLLLIYDLTTNPISFDFLIVLFLAENFRRKHSLENIDILIIGEESLEIFHDFDLIKTSGESVFSWKVYNILLPLAKMFESAENVYLTDRYDSSGIISRYIKIIPIKYNPMDPSGIGLSLGKLNSKDLVFTPSLKISKSALNIVKAYIGNDVRKIVTITLRTYDYLEVRNSNIKEWLSFAEGLDASIYRVIFIPDASLNGLKSIPLLTSFEVFEFVCWNLELRAALYKCSFVNMGVTSGPMSLSALIQNSCTLIIDRSLDYPIDYLKGLLDAGNLVGEPIPIFNDRTYFVTGKDDKETIDNLFNRYALI